MSFDHNLNVKVKEIEQILDVYLLKEEGYQKTIFQAMNYSVLAGGKRIRPLLMLETYRMMANENSCKEQVIQPFIAAIELIHTYSLVHDDLPAMDNDKYRRGKLTTHAAFGHAMGILTGDALLNYAFEISSLAFDEIEKMPETEQNILYKRVSKALQTLANYAGVYGMVGGQVVDVEQSGKPMDLSMLNFVYRLKTSALIEAAMLIGGILAGAKEDELNCIKEIASKVGLAFQIQDDILDVTSTQEVLGKPIHSDEKNEKSTYVTILGITACQNEVQRLSNCAIAKLKSLGKKDTFLEELIHYLINRVK